VVHQYPVEMAQNFWTAIFACAAAAIITIVVSLSTKQKKSDAELKGLVYSLTPKVQEETVAWYKRTNALAIFVLAVLVVLSILFW
jgi:SSS family solute:Na+ symporter